MPTPPPTPAPSHAKPSLDVRKLSIVQLQKLAAQGSRRARAELDARMQASAAPPPAAKPPPAAVPTTAVSPPMQRVPTLREPLAVPAAMPRPQPFSTPPDAAPAQNLVDQLELMARQDSERSRVDGPPRLVGMVFIVWAALVLLGALASFAYGKGGLYYLFCALSVGVVGWLLMQCSRWAMVVHGALLLVAVAWAWSSAKGSLIAALLQAAFLLAPAAWMLARPIREPLD